ncbi:ABC transporter substrate-binding protein [Halobacillus sp. A5]|uniref:ABC transporter substrate-binding protein n=1 Tax=Halobacillus sp. A5 TaxID=2880263 RepID=UPI0020A6BDC0|nr:ABC transporter substrate-binding protein [Halobacillus sp. A5]MCP3027905.1 ABC transporter substrate-binding protein [Halobacillus sp. A5]
MLKKWSLLLLVLVLSLIMSACSEESDAGDEGEDTSKGAAQELKIANDQEPAGLDPHKTPAHSSVRIYSKIYEGLVSLDENMEIEGQLAESWDQPNDDTYVFNLVEGVQFHNGREMTAEDVKYSFERILDEETASHIASYFNMVDSIEVVDDYTVQFNLSEPSASFLNNLTNASAAIVPEELVEENDGDLQQVAEGTGPFTFVEWVPDSKVTLEKNEDYYIEGQPKLDTVSYYTMKEEASRLSAIRTGEVDMTTVGAKSSSLLEDQENVEVIDYQSLEYSYVGFNVDKEPFNDEKVRQALSLATDRDKVTEIVWDGDAEQSGPVAPSMGEWPIDVTEAELYNRDIEKAKELLAEAGYENGFETEITTASTYPDMVDTAQLLQQQWAEIGVEASINQIEWGEYIDVWSDTSADVLIGRNGSGTDPDRSLNYFFHTEGSANVWNFSDGDYDQLVEEAEMESDQEARKEMYVEAQEEIINLSPNLFLVSPKNYVAVNESVADYTPYAHNAEDIVEVTKE